MLKSHLNIKHLSLLKEIREAIECYNCDYPESNLLTIEATRILENTLDRFIDLQDHLEAEKENQDIINPKLDICDVLGL